MTSMPRTWALVAMVTLLCGCSITQTVDPADMGPRSSAEICMISAKGVRQGFTDVYRDVLEEKGFAIKQLSPGSSPSGCALSTTYVGNWSWDLALYLSHADIKVFDNGRLVGRARYDSRRGGGRLDKFIAADAKIRELAEQLFPAPVQVDRALAGAVARPVSVNRNAQAAPASHREALGRWDRPAQLLAMSLGCDEAQLAAHAPGTELYTAQCPAGLTSIRCEWGECAAQ